MNRYSPHEFTFQTEWVAGRGVLLVLAFFLGGLGGGLYLVSSLFDYYPGMVLSLFIVAVGKGGSHLLYLGKPLRFWRAFRRPQSSWISRGIIAVTAFALFVALRLAPTVPGLSWLPWTVDDPILRFLAGISALVLIAYTGFALGVVNAIPFWNTAVMPVLFTVYSLLGGVGLTLGLLLGWGSAGMPLAFIERLVLWSMMVAGFLLGVHLWVSFSTNRTAEYSVTQMTTGAVRLYFLGGVVILGLLVPFVIAMLASRFELPHALLLLGVACELAGGFCLRYSILKAGVFFPLA